MRKLILAFFVLSFIGGGTLLFFTKKDAKEKAPSSGAGDSVLTSEVDTLLARDQEAGEKILVTEVSLVRPGFVVVMEIKGGAPGDIIGVSEALDSGNIKNIEISLEKEVFPTETVRAVLYADDGNKRFSISRDAPVLSVSGAPVSSDIALY